MTNLIRRIALFPIAPPCEFHTEDRTLAEPFMTSPSHLSMDRRRKRGIFDRKLSDVRESLADKLTAALHKKLKASGFGISLIESVKRSPNGLNAVEHTASPSRDPVLHVAFTEVGMSSSCWSNDYAPRVNARACLLARPDASEWLISDHYFYGADSSGDTDCSIPAHPTHHYPDFEALIDRVDEMPEVYQVAAQAIAERISLKLGSQLGHPVSS